MPMMADLPDDLRRYLAKANAEEADGSVASEAVLSAIGVAIGSLRDEAKKARESGPIENIWRDCEEAYAGIDDANRSDVYGGSQWTKGQTTDAPITSDDVPDTNNRSTLYVRLTQRYVDAGAAKLGEILLAPGAKSFSFSPTPLPELIDAKNDNRPVRMDHMPGAPLAMRALNPGEAPPPDLMASTALTPPAPTIAAPGVPAAPGAPVPAPAGGPAAMPPPAGAAGQMVPIRVKDFAKEAQEKAEEAAEKAEKRVYDWMVECRRTSQVRKVIFDAARLGVGVLKGPFPKPMKEKATRKNGDQIELGIRKTVKPASKWVNAWNFYPDPTCGEDIQDGDHVFEREWAGERQVRKLKQLPGYIKAQIDKVLIEGPSKANLKDPQKGVGEPDLAESKKGKYEIWYFHGTLTREEMGCICEMMGEKWFGQFKERTADPTRQIYAIVTMINDSVVKASFNPLESGEFPYHAMPWQRRTGSWAGVGVAEQIATPQKMLTAAVRSMLDNAGISAGGQIVIDTSVITPADGDMGMSPHKIWYLNGDGEQLDVRQAFGLFKIDNVTQQLMLVIELAMRLGEESTSIPLITQGQSGKTTPDTYGAAALQNNNANQLLRSVGYTFDDYITEPETRQYYEFLILDPDVPNDEKGDWTIDAHGSTALVEQAVQDQTIAQLLPLSVQTPAFGINPKKIMDVYLRSKKLQPQEVQYTDEEQENIDKAQQQQPADSRLQVAQIQAATKDKEIAARAEDTKADNARADRELLTRSTVELHTLELKRELAMLEYSNRLSISLDQTKRDLAKTAMTLEAQERMSQQDGERDMTKHRESQPARGKPRRQRGNGHVTDVAVAAAEPAGRAAPGRAFQA